MKLTGKRCQCMGCGEYFNRESTFSKHRVGPMDARRCLTLEEMVAKGWSRNAAGFWVTAARAWPDVVDGKKMQFSEEKVEAIAVAVFAAERNASTRGEFIRIVWEAMED